MGFRFQVKCAVLLLVSCFAIVRSVAQEPFPVTASYDNVLQRAQQENKLLFLVIHRGDSVFSRFPTTFSAAIRQSLEDRFVSGVIPLPPDSVYHPLHRTFQIDGSMYLFADSDGMPLLRYNRPISNEDTLLMLIDSARVIAEGETMGTLLQQYRKGVRSRALLRSLLELYQAFDMYTDEQVLNDYLAQLAVQELNNFETVVFLLSCGPAYDSRAYRLTHTNNKMVDSLYAALPLPQRKRINQRIINQTFRASLDDRAYSHGLGRFVANTWQPNYLRAALGQSYYQMEYHRLVKDTTSYVVAARNHYNRFYDRVSLDSLAKVDFASEQDTGRPTLDSAGNVAFLKWFSKHRKRYERDRAQGLDFASRQFLLFGEDHPQALSDAIRWQQKAIALWPDNPRFRHTLALLLYQVGFYAQAEAEQEQVVDDLEDDSLIHRYMLDVLERLRARTL